MTTGESATEMTLGMMMENMKLVSKVDGGYGVIRGLLKYPEGKGWIGFITHGRRFELDRLAKATREAGEGGASNLKPGSLVQFDFLSGSELAKVVSDIDLVAGVIGESLKRQGKTLDGWVAGKSKEWLELWVAAASVSSGGGPIRFVLGEGLPKPKTIEKIEEAAARAGIDFEIIYDSLLPPPAID